MESIPHQHRERIALQIISNIEFDLKTKPKKTQLDIVHIKIYRMVICFFEKHDLYIFLGYSLEPFNDQKRYARKINGKPCETYIN